MIKVRILQGLTAAGAAALALPSLAGCTSDATEDAIGNDSANNTESIAGSGNLALHSYSLHYTSTTGGDEFLRVGEKMTVAVAWSDVLDKLAYQFDPAQAALRAALSADPSKVKLTLKLTYTKFDESKLPASLTMKWAPGPGGVLAGTSPEFVIPSGAKLLSVEVVADYDKNGTPATVEVIKSQGIPNEFVVFGAFVPEQARALRHLRRRAPHAHRRGRRHRPRRACDALVHRLAPRHRDRQGAEWISRIGQKTSASRFGPVVIDALGSLDYEVTAAISTDGGATYNPVDFAKVMRPAVLARSEGCALRARGRARHPRRGRREPSKVAFHVKAFLQVPNYAPGEIKNARYAPGARILLKDVWDNNDGKDYSLP